MMVVAVADSDFPIGIVHEPNVDALILSNHAVEAHQASAFEASLVAEPASVAGLVPCAVGADLAAGVDIALGAATRFVPGSATTSDCIGVPVAGATASTPYSRGTNGHTCVMRGMLALPH